MIKSYKKYIQDLLHLALPIIMGHIGFTFIMAGDVFVAGKYSGGRHTRRRVRPERRRVFPFDGVRLGGKYRKSRGAHQSVFREIKENTFPHRG